MINLSGSVIMNVAFLSIIIFKYSRNILMIDLIHEYSDDVINYINEFQNLKPEKFGFCMR